MRILCTFPGRAGDLLWALPTVRALSEHVGVPVDLCCCGEFASLVPLLQQQPYLGAVWADPDWALVPPAEWRHPPQNEAHAAYDRVYALGYRGWPQQALPFEVQRILRDEYALHLPIDLSRPWITIPPLPLSWGTACLPCGFTETWFELKVGIVHLLEDEFEYTQAREASGALTTALMPVSHPGGRWAKHFAGREYTWIEATEFISASAIFFGDCSALHVLALALGKPKLVIMEPMDQRWNDIFWPFGKTGRVELVVGTDGQPTFDVGHCADALRKALQEAQ